MGRTLTGKQLKSTYQELVQISGSKLTDGLGNDINSVDVTASNAVTASFFAGTVENAVTASYVLGSGVDGVVANATNATTATSATTAGTAATASYVEASNIDGTVATATSASHALEADSATTATSATTADSATSASYATTASFAENGGVTSIIAGTNITIDQSTGDVTISAAGGGGGDAFPFSGSAVITGSVLFGDINNTAIGDYSAIISSATASISSAGGAATYATIIGSKDAEIQYQSATFRDTDVILGSQDAIIGEFSNSDGSNFIIGVSSNGRVQGYNSGVIGGYSNRVLGGVQRNQYVFGGVDNFINGGFGVRANTIVGGQQHTLNGNAAYCTIVGGFNNDIGGSAAANAIVGGQNNTVDHANSVIVGGNGLSTTKSDEVVVPKLVIAEGTDTDVFQIINSGSLDFADDSAAATGGVPLGGIYHTSGAVKIRMA